MGNLLRLLEGNKIEKFREINGYKIYRDGTIIGKRGRPIGSQQIDPTTGENNGYIACTIDLGDLGMAHGIHRAIAMTFIPNPNNLPETNHKNGIKNDNRVENLEWVTNKENQDHASYVLGRRVGENYHNPILTDTEVIKIYELCKQGTKHAEVAEKYGILPEHVYNITKGKRWKHLGLEPLPKLPRGLRSKGRRAPPPQLYKVTDTLTGVENVYRSSMVAGDAIGGSSTTVRYYANGKNTKELMFDRYKIEALPWIPGLPKHVQVVNLEEYVN
jgi:hypothetical protein